MSKTIPSVTTTARRAVLEHRLVETARDFLVVTDKDGMLAGLITADELEASSGGSASVVMVQNPPSVDRKAKLVSAMAIMQESRLSYVPVIDNGHVCGVLTYDELLVTLQCTLQLLHEIYEEHRKILLGTVSETHSHNG